MVAKNFNRYWSRINDWNRTLHRKSDKAVYQMKKSSKNSVVQMWCNLNKTIAQCIDLQHIAPSWW